MDLQGDQLQLKYIPLAQVIPWDENPKRHDIGGLITSIKRYGFVDPPKFDPSLNDGKGGIVYGNGRSECVKMIKAETPHEVPRGVLVDENGEWYLPVLFGLDAESEAVARALALDHNNLTMLGGDFDMYDMAKMWDRDGYSNLLRSFQTADIPPVSMNEDDIAAYLHTMNSNIEGREYDEGIANGVVLEATFKIKLPVAEADGFEQALDQLLEKFPSATKQKII